jgi:cytochrome c55X
MATTWSAPRLRRRIAIACLAALVPATGAAQSPDAGREAELVNLVRQDCGSCHGMTLKGGLGRPLLPEQLEHLDAEALTSIILGGVPGTPMPPWRGLITDDEAAWIAKRLKTGFPQ